VINTKSKKSKTGQLRKILIFSIPIAFLITILIISWVNNVSQQFSDLAQAFIHGKLHFLSSIGGYGQDPILYNGKIFWGEGPFPAIILMPFVGLFDVFHQFFYQGYLQWFFVLGVIYFLYKLARHLSYSVEDSAILTFGFILGSSYIGIAALSSSWSFAQVVTCFLLFWSLYEFYARKRWWLIGLICGFILMTRVTAAPIIIFYALEFWQSSRADHLKLKKFMQLSLPFLVSGFLIAIYNFLRFHSPFNGGYKYQLLVPNSAQSRAYGIFSLIHIPANFYSAVFGAPLTVVRSSTSWTLKFPFIESNPYGMSIFITSPYFLYLFTQKWKSFNTQARNLMTASFVSFFMLLCFYGIGISQYGYRYSLDFLPEMFLVFMIVYRVKHNFLSRGMKVLLLGTGVFNFYLIWSFIQ